MMDTLAHATSAWGLHLPESGVPRRIARTFQASGTEVLGEIKGPGCIRRIWFTGARLGRELVLRIYFDGATVPHVEAPLSDFFGVMHNLSESNRDNKNPDREPYTINTPFFASKPHNGFTCYLPMPFARSVRIEVENGTDKPSRLYYIVDWLEYKEQEFNEPMRFCARWRREAPVRDYQDDFLILDADGPGRLIGFVHSIDMLHDRYIMRWSHAGSDNLYIDGEGPCPAFLRGIGGEDTFGTSYGGNCYAPQSALYSDMPFYQQKNVDNDDWQKLVGYRFFAHDPVPFNHSLHFRFGARAHDIATTVYWYSSAPVRPYAAMPPYEQRLPGVRPRRAYDLELPDTATWWVSGPFPLPFAAELPTSGAFDPNRPYQDRLWRHQAALRGFVEFNHTFRPSPSNNNSATLVDAGAIARCDIMAPEASRATLTFGWDDRLVFRVNDGPAVDLGLHAYFQSQSVEVELKKGRNALAVLLTNTTGLSAGGWNFSFGAVTTDGRRLVPQVEFVSPKVEAGHILALDFGAGESTPQAGYLSFVPPYSEDLGARLLGKSVDILCSPQSQMFCSPVGPLRVTAAAGENTAIGFRERDGVNEGPFKEESALLQSEVRAEGHPGGEPVSLTVTVEGLPPGEYAWTSHHHCHAADESLHPLRVMLGDVEASPETLLQTSGLNPSEVAECRLTVSGGAPVSVTFASTSAVVLNGFRIERL